MATTNIGTSGTDLDTFEHHWQDEADAAFLYRILAKAERYKLRYDAAKQHVPHVEVR